MFKSMKRSDLYVLVWSKPMTKAAIELGVSDVGLAKACRRNAIPVPPRGHWAKLAAGKSSPQAPLPQPDQDFTVELQATDPKAKAEAIRKRQENDALVEEKAKLLAQQSDTERSIRGKVDPLVKATRKYIATIPRLERRYQRLSPLERLHSNLPSPPYLDKGRRFIKAPEGLIMAVSDQSTEWATDLYDQLIRTLTIAGCKFFLAKRDNERQESVACELNGERLYFSFSEGYRKHVFLADELAARAKAGEYRQDWVWEPSGRFTWSVVGTEWQCKAQLVGTHVEIEAKLPVFAATCLHLLEELPKLRRERLAAERKRQADEAERARLQRMATARKEQVTLAYRLADERAKEESAIAHLDRLGSELHTYAEPFRQRLETWIEVVRSELAQESPYLKTLSEAVSSPYWRDGPPDWWPESRQWPDGAGKTEGS